MDKKFEPAFSRKLKTLIESKAIKFKGKNAKTLKAELSIMPNFKVVLM